MSRKKISEFRAKSILAEALKTNYVGWSISEPGDLKDVAPCEKYVVKVDQAVKGRFKKGLVKLGVYEDGLKAIVEDFFVDGYTSLIIEPYIEHNSYEERYLSIRQERSGLVLSYSESGGIDIESNAQTIKSVTLNNQTDWALVSKETLLNKEQLSSLFSMFKANHFVFLEINPYIISGGAPLVLDCAVEIDDAGHYFTSDWDESDIRHPRKFKISESETVVNELNVNSPASFNLSVLNPNGSIFLLLSGGGASVVVADEIYNNGLGQELANYGEYSGNPSTQETYIYTKQVLKLVLGSDATKKILFIGGAVANFTDIASTFKGVIKALNEFSSELNTQSLKVYVRRGGPNQVTGLKSMTTALSNLGILGGIYDPKTSIIKAVSMAIEGLKT